MSDENALATIGETAIAPVADLMDALPASPDDKTFDETVGSTDSLPYVILLQLGADLAKPPHNQTAGNFYIIDNPKQSFTSLGNEFNAMILGWHLRAMAYNDNEVLAVNDPKDPMFVEYQAKAEAKVKDTHRYLWGPEYLLYIPTLDQYVSFFCNNATMRRAAKQMIHAFVKKQLTFKHQWIESKGYSWWGLIATECLNPIDAIDVNRALEVTNKFLNPPKRTKEAGSPFAQSSETATPTSVDGENR